MENVEKRFYPIDVSSVRIERREEGEAPRIVGMAPPYESWSPIYGDMRERFARGAFEDSTEDVIATVEHDDRMIFGRQSAGTLDLDDREDGAWYSATLGNRSYERDLIESIERGEIRGSSFEFYALKQDWQKTKDSEGATVYERTILKAVRLQVGPVARPFYDTSKVAMRSLEAWMRGEEGPDMELAFLKVRQAHLKRLMELR